MRSSVGLTGVSLVEPVRIARCQDAFICRLGILVCGNTERIDACQWHWVAVRWITTRSARLKRRGYPSIPPYILDLPYTPWFVWGIIIATMDVNFISISQFLQKPWRDLTRSWCGFTWVDFSAAFVRHSQPVTISASCGGYMRGLPGWYSQCLDHRLWIRLSSLGCLKPLNSILVGAVPFNP